MEGMEGLIEEFRAITEVFRGKGHDLLDFRQLLGCTSEIDQHEVGHVGENAVTGTGFISFSPLIEGAQNARRFVDDRLALGGVQQQQTATVDVVQLVKAEGAFEG